MRTSVIKLNSSSTPAKARNAKSTLAIRPTLTAVLDHDESPLLHIGIGCCQCFHYSTVHNGKPGGTGTGR